MTKAAPAKPAAKPKRPLSSLTNHFYPSDWRMIFKPCFIETGLQGTIGETVTLLQPIRIARF